MAVANINQGSASLLQLIFEINNTNNNTNKGNNDNDSCDDDDDSIGDNNEITKTSIINSDQGSQNNDKINNKNKTNKTTGVRRSKCKHKGKTDRHSNYGLFMAVRQQTRAGPQQTTIQDGVMHFLAADLSNAKLFLFKDCKEWVLGVALA
jgi:hypothetical protein